MKYFKRKTIIAILILFSAVMILFSSLLLLMVNNSSSAVFLILVALLFAYDFCVYVRPYLGLDKERLVVNSGLSKKEVIYIKDVTSIEEKNKKLIITYSQGTSTKKLKILLSQLKKHDKEQFIQELKSKLGDLGLCG